MPKPNKYRKKPIGFEFTPMDEASKVKHDEWICREEFEFMLEITEEQSVDWLLAKHCLEALDSAEQEMPGQKFVVTSVDEIGIHVTTIVLKQ